jgi:hypothetical protein
MYTIADHEQMMNMGTAKYYRTCQMSFCTSLLKDPNHLVEFVSLITSSFKVEVYHSRPHRAILL